MTAEEIVKSMWEEMRQKERRYWELHHSLEDDGYVYRTKVRDIPVFYKKVEGNGKWKAILDNEIIDITYEQALGREAIRPIDKMAMFLGKMLLPN